MRVYPTPSKHMKTLNKPHPVEFTFAGFNFPKWVWNLPPRNLKTRLERYRNPVTGGGYYHAPKPEQAGKGCEFYLSDKSAPINLRWKWCDEVATRIRHTGWFCDNHYSEKIRGIVFRLPRSRGFLIGWSMGEGMASGIETDIYEEEMEAAYAADSLAESIAEREREYQESLEEEEEEEEEEEVE